MVQDMLEPMVQPNVGMQQVLQIQRNLKFNLYGQRPSLVLVPQILRQQLFHLPLGARTHLFLFLHLVHQQV